MLDRPAGRQPGARQPDGRRSQAPVLRPADRARDQGDRGRLPVGLEDGLRLRAHARRPGPDSGGRHDRRVDAGAARADRAHLRVDRRCSARDRPSLQLHLGHAAAGRVPPRPRRHHRPGGSRHDALQAARGRDGDRDRLPVLARELPPHRAGLRARDLRAGRGGVGADAGGEDDRQPADDGRAVPPERLRRPDGVVRTALLVPRRLDPVRPPAQRPRHRGRHGRARADGRCRARRGNAVRQRGAHGQCRPRHDRAQPA